MNYFFLGSISTSWRNSLSRKNFKMFPRTIYKADRLSLTSPYPLSPPLYTSHWLRPAATMPRNNERVESSSVYVVQPLTINQFLFAACQKGEGSNLLRHITSKEMWNQRPFRDSTPRVVLIGDVCCVVSSQCCYIVESSWQRVSVRPCRFPKCKHWDAQKKNLENHEGDHKTR